ADPVTMHAAAAPAARAALASAGCAPGELAAVELDETFAAAALCAMSELDLDPSAVNRSGGSLALGDPPGATGARLAVNLLAELERSGGRWGLAVAGGAGGVAQAVVLERLP
ncbi:MAG: acetyl-CoA C-acetyltransferase, partial [Acidimicrobiales bacterium]